MITWKSLTADQLKALRAVEDNKDIRVCVWQELQSMGLVAFDEGSDADYLTPLGESVYNAYRAAQQPEADSGAGVTSRNVPIEALRVHWGENFDEFIDNIIDDLERNEIIVNDEAIEVLRLLQAENARLRGELDAARGKISDLQRELDVMSDDLRDCEQS